MSSEYLTSYIEYSAGLLMIILTTTNHFSRLTGLPMHGSNPNYSGEILSEVEDALSEYKQLNINAAKENRPKPDPIVVKESLIEISNDWYKIIMDIVPKNINKLIKVDDIS
jgi:hypothetical protein